MGKDSKDNVSCSQNLSVLNATIKSKMYNSVYVTCTDARKLVMECYVPGFFFRIKHNPRKNHIGNHLVMNHHLRNLDMTASDYNDPDDFEYCKEQSGITSKDRKVIDSVVMANKICRDATKQSDLSARKETLKRALAVCPKHCPLAHFL